MSYKMGFELKYSTDNCLLPISFTPWHSEVKKNDIVCQDPLKYLNDVLVSMNFDRLTDYKYCQTQDKKIIENHLRSIDPYFELFRTSHARLQNHIKYPKNHTRYQKFENQFCDLIDQTFTAEGVQFKFLNKCINAIADFETELGQNLIYNFKVHFSDEFNQKLLSLYSFLFHTRTLFALNHNYKMEDSCFESVKCDSITDYLSKSDFTANDALIYWQFKKLSIPFSGAKDVKIEKLFINPLESAFRQYNHNACTLIDNLPESFLTHSSIQKLEDHLYQIQMDWLLGSGAGILFRLREELYGVTQGYSHIFWPDAQLPHSDPSHLTKTQSLNVSFEFGTTDFNQKPKAG